MRILKSSRSHLHEVEESYFEHMGHAARFGGRMILAGSACLAHAVCPALFPRTGSGEISRLHHEMSRRSSEEIGEERGPFVSMHGFRS